MLVNPSTARSDGERHRREPTSTVDGEPTLQARTPVRERGRDLRIEAHRSEPRACAAPRQPGPYATELGRIAGRCIQYVRSKISSRRSPGVRYASTRARSRRSRSRASLHARRHLTPWRVDDRLQRAERHLPRQIAEPLDGHNRNSDGNNDRVGDSGMWRTARARRGASPCEPARATARGRRDAIHGERSAGNFPATDSCRAACPRRA